MDENQQPPPSAAKPSRFHAAVDSLLNKLICGKQALLRKKKFWIALPVIYFVMSWVWPFGWMRWLENNAARSTRLPELTCAGDYPDTYQGGWVGSTKGDARGFETHPTDVVGVGVLSDPLCLVSHMKRIAYYEGKWVLDITDPRTRETLFTIIKHPTPEGRPAHEGSIKKP